MIEWMHTGVILRAYNPDTRQRGMIIKRIDNGVIYSVFIGKGEYAGSTRTMGRARELCEMEIGGQIWDTYTRTA